MAARTEVSKAQVLDGKKIAQSVRQLAKQEAISLATSYTDFPKPKLVIVQVKDEKRCCFN